MAKIGQSIIAPPPVDVSLSAYTTADGATYKILETGIYLVCFEAHFNAISTANQIYLGYYNADDARDYIYGHEVGANWERYICENRILRLTSGTTLKLRVKSSNAIKASTNMTLFKLA